MSSPSPAPEVVATRFGLAIVVYRDPEARAARAQQLYLPGREKAARDRQEAQRQCDEWLRQQGFASGGDAS